MLQIIDNYGPGLVSMLQILFFARFTLDKKLEFSKQKLCFIVILFSLFYSFIFSYLDGIIKTLMVSFVNVFIYINFYKESLAKSIFSNFIYIIILIFPDLLILFCLTEIFNVNKDFYYNIFAGGFLGSFAVSICFMIIVFLMRKPLKKLLDTKIDTDKKIVLFSVLTFICVLLFFYALVEKFRFTNDILLYLGCIVILLLVLFSLIKQVINNKILTNKYDKLLEFMTTYENEIEKQRILRHEAKNEFLSIKAKLCDKQKNKEIIDYIDEILKEKIIVSHEKYAKFGYLPPNGIKGLCYFKVQEAENKNLKVSINISKKVQKFNISALTISEQRNLARILGVFLDNAIEASSNSEKKQLGLEFYLDDDKKLAVIISNTFNNDINKSKLGKERFSTKGKSRGYGLLLVKNIIDKSNIFEIKTDVLSGIYVQVLHVKEKNK